MKGSCLPSTGRGFREVVYPQFRRGRSGRDPDIKSKILVVKFNPWWLTRQEALLLQFLRTFRAALNEPDVPKTLRDIADRFDSFSGMLTPLTWVPNLGNVAETAKQLSGSVAETLREFAGKSDEDVFSIRDQIDKALRAQEARILVIIDDIDRLSAAEVRQVFQLVKAVANFPKTIYLLAFDNVRVAEALNEERGGSGQDYLDKIIQVPFDIHCRMLQRCD